MTADDILARAIVHYLQPDDVVVLTGVQLVEIDAEKLIDELNETLDGRKVILCGEGVDVRISKPA